MRERERETHTHTHTQIQNEEILKQHLIFKKVNFLNHVVH